MLIHSLPGCILTGAFAVTCALQDLRSMSVDLRLFLLMGTAEFGWYLYSFLSGRPPDPHSIGGALLMGLLLFLLSRFSDGALGEGDALFFLLTGGAAGLKLQLWILFCAVMSAGLFSLVLVTVSFAGGRDSRKKSFPFLPFALLPTLICLIREG